MKYFLSVLILCFYIGVHGQAEHVIDIDRTSGSFVKTGPPIPNVTYVYGESSTLDEVNGIMYFAAQSDCECYFGINVTNGAVVSNPAFPKYSWGFQFDNSANILYALKVNTTTATKSLITVDPVMGTSNLVGNSVQGPMYQQANIYAFNKHKQIYTFRDTDGKLVSLKASDGSTIASPLLQLLPSETLINFTYSIADSALYGLLLNGNMQKCFVSKINTSTGVCTKIGAGTSHTLNNGSCAIDEDAKQFIFLGSGNTLAEITTLDLVTGAELHHHTLWLNNGENVWGLRYDNVRQKLLALHWSIEFELVGLNESSLPTGSGVFPNPIKESGVINFKSTWNGDATLTLMDASGRTVRTVTGIENKSVDFKKEHLSNGLYMYKLENKNGLIDSGKFLIE